MKGLYKYILLITIALFCLLACSNKESTSTFERQLTQTITSGQVKGVQDKKNQVLQWLGIPYAKAPVGKLRWREPQAVEHWSKTFDATKYGNTAIQTASDGKVSGSEDALNLDVVRPDTEQSKLPVIVFVHGGNNQTGSSQEIKGNSFVRDLNAVYVSVNYRLGPLGFNPLPALKKGNAQEKSGNYSLLDIAAALDWVKENIEKFGGDADNITLAGFSAGGRDVMASLISPIFKGKFHKAISFSGGMTLADEKTSQETFAQALAPLVVEDGKKASLQEAQAWLLSDDKAVADYLYSIKAERLSGLMSNAMIRMSVFPHLYKDGQVIPKEGFETKNYNDVPLMLVTGTSEFSLFAAYDPYFAKDFADKTLMTNSSKLAEFRYARQYGGEFYRLSNGVESARTMAKHYQSKIYIGEISYGENAQVTPTLANTFAAFHGIFEPFLQEPSNYQVLIGQDFYNDGEEKLAQQFKAHLKNFIATGKASKDWQAWTKEKENIFSLDADKENSQSKLIQDRETAQEIIAKMEADQTLTAEQKKKINEEVLNGRWFSQPLDQSSFNYKKSD